MAEQRQHSTTPLGRALEHYRKLHGMKIVDLADYLSVSERTVSRWKNGENVITDIRELSRIAELLGVTPESLGVVSLPVPLSPEQIDTSTDQLWKLVKDAKYYEANMLVDKLIYDVASLIQTEDIILLRKLALVQHIAGYVKSQTTRSDNTAIPFSHYREMERIARILEDQTLLNIALTYEGDMLQRGGRVEESIQYLEVARDTTPNADASARGNSIQLLGRAYFKAHRLGDFERAIKEAELLAHEPQVGYVTSSARGQFSAGTVYEEYGRSLGLLGQTTRGMEYLEKADENFRQSWSAQRRDILMTTARSMVLVHGGEIQQGVDLAVEAIELCRKYGNIRLLERIYGVQQYIDRLSREIGNAGSALRDALAGSVEY